MKEDADYKQILSAVHPQVVKAKHSTADQVVKEAFVRMRKEEREGNPYDSVWVVFDHDNDTNREKAYLDAKKKDFKIAFSAIAFEYWFLLHFEKKARAYSDNGKLIKDLLTHYNGYEKTKQNDFENLKSRLPIAMQNAEWLRKQVLNEEIQITDHNPWTEVDILVKFLTTLS